MYLNRLFPTIRERSRSHLMRLITLGVFCSLLPNFAKASELDQLKHNGELSWENRRHRFAHSLIKERYPNTIGLPDLIRKAATSGQVAKLLTRLKLLMETATGITIDLGDNLSETPEKLLNYLQFTAEQFDRKRDVISDLARKNALIPFEDKLAPAILRITYQLPQTFDYSRESTVDIKLNSDDLPAIGKNVYFGFLKDKRASDAQIRANVIFSEVIERLSINLFAEKENRFRVIFNDTSYERLDRFLNALENSGHEITGTLRHYVAPFIPLYTKTDDGTYIPVAATVFQRTGIFDDNGKEALLPTLHSEIVFDVKPISFNTGDTIQASIQYYQGIPKMGFYGMYNARVESWLGMKTTDVFSPREGKKALLLAGYMVDINRTIVRKKNYILDGWGATGICNDSVAIVQMALKGRVNSYPLLMEDEQYLGEINSRLELSLEELTPLDSKIHLILKRAIEQTPQDIEPSLSQIERILTSLPWKKGREPFYSAVEARSIIEMHLKNPPLPNR